MPYNRVNLLTHYKAIVEFTKQEFKPEVMKYKPFWRTKFWPVYHISYSQYMAILSIPNLNAQLEAEKKAHGRWEDPAQMELF